MNGYVLWGISRTQPTVSTFSRRYEHGSEGSVWDESSICGAILLDQL